MLVPAWSPSGRCALASALSPIARMTRSSRGPDIAALAATCWPGSSVTRPPRHATTATGGVFGSTSSPACEHDHLPRVVRCGRRPASGGGRNVAHHGRAANPPVQNSHLGPKGRRRDRRRRAIRVADSSHEARVEQTGHRCHWRHACHDRRVHMAGHPKPISGSGPRQQADLAHRERGQHDRGGRVLDHRTSARHKRGLETRHGLTLVPR
jgi:hypothetical protein